MIRQATQEDYPTFLRLWLDFIQSQQEQGDTLLPTPRTVSFYTLLFAAYVSGARKGVVLLDNDKAVVLVGEPLADSPFDTSDDPVAHGWGIYVAPEHRGSGISRALYDRIKKDLREMGFNSISTSVLSGNEPGLGSLNSEGYDLGRVGGVLRLNSAEEE